MEFTLCSTAATLPWQLQCVFWKPDYFPVALRHLCLTVVREWLFSPRRAIIHWLKQHNFKMNSPDCLDCSRWAKAYLAVCSTDRKSNIGSYHNCERRSQLNSESTAGSIRKHFTITLCISLDWYLAVCQSLTRFFFRLFYLQLIFVTGIS